MTADNFKQFIEENFYLEGSSPHWSWIESYETKLTEKFKRKLIKIIEEKEGKDK